MSTGAAAALHTVRETELKLTVPDDAGLDPAAALGGPVAAVADATVAVLSTTYFDTPDLRLAREGITLRRRLGDDEGWHLKVPAGAEGRPEIRTEPTGSTPPPALLDLVRGYTRFAPVREVATLETTRTTRRLLGPDGDLLGVVVDDSVRVLDGSHERSRFREIEVEAAPEVTEPGPLLDAVADRLTAAGASVGSQVPKLVQALGPAARQPPSPPPAREVGPNDTAAAVVTAHLRTAARAVLERDVGVRRELPDAVHQLRVAADRFRGTLSVFGPLFEAEPRTGLVDEVGWAADVLGEADDRSALLARLERHIRDLPLADAERAALAEYVAGALGAELTAARARVPDVLGGSRYLHLVERMVAVASAPPLVAEADLPARDVLPARLGTAAQALHRAGSLVRPDSADAAYAPVRRAAADACCAAELTAAVLGAPAEALARMAGQVRVVLGEHRDAVAAAEAAHGLLRRGVPSPVAFGLGMLAAEERSAERLAVGGFLSVWRDIGDVLPLS